MATVSQSPPAAGVKWSRRWLLISAAVVVLTYFCLTPASAYASVDIAVASTDVTLASAGGGAHTASVTIVNVGDSVATVAASVVPEDPGCSVTPSVSTIPPGPSTTDTLTLSSGCSTSGGVDIELLFGAGTTPRAITIHAAPAGEAPNWELLGWSFLGSFIAALLFCALVLFWKVRGFKGQQPPDPSGGQQPTPPPLPRPEIVPGGAIPKGTYSYVLTSVSKEGETLISAPSEPVQLSKRSKLQLQIPTGPAGTTERRIYRRRGAGKAFHRVGFVGDNQTTTYTDNWARPGWSTPLMGLGTDWSFKDNWVSSVTIGSGVLIALLASSNVLEAVLGSKPEAALGLLAVAGALGAVFVGIGPLFVKLWGDDLSVPTIGGTLSAAFLTLAGTLGQIAVVTGQGWELATNDLVRGIVIALGALTVTVLFLYAYRALRSYAKTSVRFEAAAPSELLTAAALVAAAIRKQAPEALLPPSLPPQARARNSLL